MEIIHIEKNGIVCVTVKGKTEAELTIEFKEVVNKLPRVIKDDCSLIWVPWNI